MLFSIENVEELENLNESISLQNEVKEKRLQYQLGEHN